MQTEAQIRAKKKYFEKCQQLRIVFYPTEADMSEHVSDMHNKTGYIKDLIRRDIEFDNREALFYQQSENLSTKTVVTRARQMLESVGHPMPSLTVDDARRVYARFMAASDYLVPPVV